MLEIAETCNRQPQPPSGGCVLKHWDEVKAALIRGQPPSGGCVLKLQLLTRVQAAAAQPPSGGCVLKQRAKAGGVAEAIPAAFRRLCVETMTSHCTH